MTITIFIEFFDRSISCLEIRTSPGEVGHMPSARDYDERTEPYPDSGYKAPVPDRSAKNRYRKRSLHRKQIVLKKN